MASMDDLIKEKQKLKLETYDSKDSEKEILSSAKKLYYKEKAKDAARAVGGFFGTIGRGINKSVQQYKDANSPEKKLERLKNQLAQAKIKRQVREVNKDLRTGRQDFQGMTIGQGNFFTGGVTPKEKTSYAVNDFGFFGVTQAKKDTRPMKEVVIKGKKRIVRYYNQSKEPIKVQERPDVLGGFAGASRDNKVKYKYSMNDWGW